MHNFWTVCYVDNLGTYFPPNDTPQQTGFKSVLKLVSDKVSTMRLALKDS
jgi:hypothetical protein